MKFLACSSQSDERERERDFHFFGEMRWWSEVQRKTVKTGIKRGIMKVEKGRNLHIMGNISWSTIG